MNIFWFRRDLRVEDNAGLFHALSAGDEVLPIFIFDSSILGLLEKNDARVTLIHDLLLIIQKKLELKNKSLAIFYGNPLEIFKELCDKHHVNTIFTNKDYEPYAIKRDLEIATTLAEKGIGFQLYKDQVIFEQNEVIKDNNTPYLVFTPYSHKWKKLFRNDMSIAFKSEDLLEKIITHLYPFLSLTDIGFERSTIQVSPFHLNEETILNYETNRNFPAKDLTTYLSPHLRFGSVSIREIIKQLAFCTNPSLLNELIWREFFMQILWHFPKSSTHCFNSKYEKIPWIHNEAHFEAWKNGKTGYPMVDAGIRQLNATGYMHNRVRMIVAGFLCKHLLIDWRWGEAYFASKLLDYDMSANVGNWQWAAGTGVDAAPYFRIFNPTEQAKKFDSKREYILKWIPEIDTLDYPSPIVEHSWARERCIKYYKQYLGG